MDNKLTHLERKLCASQSGNHFPEVSEEKKVGKKNTWLVVLTHLKNMSQVGRDENKNPETLFPSCTN